MANENNIVDIPPNFLETLLNDFKNLQVESKKKFPQLKEACEEAINKLKASTHQTQSSACVGNQIIYPLSQGCDTKDTKIVKCCLQIMQKLIVQQLIDHKGAIYLTDTLWALMEAGIEEVKILQLVILLLTTNTVVHGDTLARTLVLCFRLHFAKNSTTINTAGATVRQLVNLVFERVVNESTNSTITPIKQETDTDELKVPSSTPPKHLKPHAADGYLLFQDLVQLVNADQPYWLMGMTEMTRTFGLELLESVLTQFPEIFYNNEEFSFLLKERMCALVIKLFSPNIKYRTAIQSNLQQAASFERPHFPISMRLLRVVSILILKYHELLVTECEIFLSLIVKFLDPDKPAWQRALALEVLHKMVVQPNVLNAFCRCYDLNEHSTNIFRDIVNSMGAFVQSSFINHQLQLLGSMSQVSSSATVCMSLASTSLSPSIGSTSTTSATSSHHNNGGFYLRGMMLPLTMTFPSGQTKSIYLDMLDKNEAPQIADGYGLTVVYACLIEIVQSIRTTTGTNTAVDNNNLHCQLIKSSWCGLLSAFYPLIEASTDEVITDHLLQAMQTYTALCGLLHLEKARDAFIIGMCKASLPPHYAVNVLNSAQVAGAILNVTSSSNGHDISNNYQHHSSTSMAGGSYTDGDYKQVVAVGTTLPTVSSVNSAGVQHHGPVMLTSKNLQVMKALLNLSIQYGSVLGKSWLMVLSTLQHLVWILGLKPSTGGSLKTTTLSKPQTSASTQPLLPPSESTNTTIITTSNNTITTTTSTMTTSTLTSSSNTTNNNAVITTTLLADLPQISSMLSQLFQSSRHLDTDSLDHLVRGLCTLSEEAMTVAYTNREPSLFAVAKLLETGIVNMDRIDLWWVPMTNHLLLICQHPHIRMREWGVEAVTYLVKTALRFKHSPPATDSTTAVKKDPLRLQLMLLRPLYELSNEMHIFYVDVRQRQLECVLEVLHSSGDVLYHGWHVILPIVGGLDDQHNETLIRIAFQCLQLIIADYLPVMPWHCLQLCIDTVAKFGWQTQDLNISLTAVGLMWNISDYFHHNHVKLSRNISADSSVEVIFPIFPGIATMPVFDKLWMCLYDPLGKLCADARPAVRKSAGQTLFSTLTAHGSLLRHTTWPVIIWQVLFPLLHKVQNLSNMASDEKVDAGGNILIHHTRNTAQKQWAETQVLTLSGVVRVFITKRQLLQTLDGDDLLKTWQCLMDTIETAALNRNSEVSLAALKSFSEVLFGGQTKTKTSMPEIITTTTTTITDNEPLTSSSLPDIWYIAWRTWLKIGVQILSTPIATAHIYYPNQAYLTALVHIFPSIFQRLRHTFQLDDVKQFGEIIVKIIQVPIVDDSTAPCLIMTMSDLSLNPLHETILSSFELIRTEAIHRIDGQMIAELINRLLYFGQFLTVRSPATTTTTNNTPQVSDSNAAHFISFAQKAIQMVSQIYDVSARNVDIIHGNILDSIVATLHTPLSLRYGNTVANNVWKISATTLITVLKCGLPVARDHPDQFRTIWPKLNITLNAFLFPAKYSILNNKDIDENNVTDETIDCQLIQLLKSEILPYANCIPKEFIMQMVLLLNKGSIHSANNSIAMMDNDCGGSDLMLREEFAKVCFETLLEFSVVSDGSKTLITNDDDDDDDIAGALAITSLLQRFREVLERYIEDEKISGKCPLPRYRLSEISFVLKAIGTLIISMKKAPALREDLTAWQHLIKLYPYLVACTLTTSTYVSRPLKDVLMQFYELLQPPKPPTTTTTAT